MSEYDNRQYRLMLDRIEKYQHKKLKLRTLIGDLEGLLGCLQEVDENWKEEFLKAWGVLEEVYSFAIYEEKKELSEKDKELIHKAITELGNMVKQQLQ